MGAGQGPSSTRSTSSGASIERAAAARGWELVDVVTDLNRSGADRARPQFRAALERLTSREVDAMVVWKVSRFARDLTQARVDIDAILNAGADLVAGDEPFDTSSPQGRLMLNMLQSFAEYEREVLGEQFEVIKERVLQRGSHLGRVPSAIEGSMRGPRRRPRMPSSARPRTPRALQSAAPWRRGVHGRKPHRFCLRLHSAAVRRPQPSGSSCSAAVARRSRTSTKVLRSGSPISSSQSRST